MEKGSMLSVLTRVVRDLPQLLAAPDRFQSLDINYEPPRVERLWCSYDDYRVNLHRIHPCDKALFHPHPWPSAVKILSGVYEMEVGWGLEPNADWAPPVATTLLLTTGSSYEMIDPNGWHSVRPILGPSLSVMVTGRPWQRHIEKRPIDKLRPLSNEAVQDLLEAFRWWVAR